MKNPKKIKHYDFTRLPQKPDKFWVWAARTFVMPRYFRGRRVTVLRAGMEGVKPPYLLLSTHAGLVDFPVIYRAIAPEKANIVTPLDAHRDLGDLFLRRFGCICTRKFVKDDNLVRNLKYCAETYKTALCLFPERRYSLDGTTGRLPNSLGELCKALQLPVVTLRMEGNFIAGPQWNKAEIRSIPLRAEMKCVASKEEVASLTADALSARIQEGLSRDEYRYQLEYAIENKYQKRAEGLHHILYQCPHCLHEFKMYSEGTRLWCSACGKAWEMDELGQLKAEEGITEFSHIPDWTKWERENVRQEVRGGKYRFDADVRVYTLPNAKRFYKQGTGRLTQTSKGTSLVCTAYGEKRTLQWDGAEMDGVHVEYDYPWNKLKYRRNAFGDCAVFSAGDESYWCHPVEGRTRLTKLSFATEEIYLMSLEQNRAE